MIIEFNKKFKDLIDCPYQFFNKLPQSNWSGVSGISGFRFSGISGHGPTNWIPIFFSPTYCINSDSVVDISSKMSLNIKIFIELSIKNSLKNNILNHVLNDNFLRYPQRLMDF